MDVVSLVTAGKELGLEGVELKQWVEAQEGKIQAAEREKRAADREAAKEAAELRLRELEATNEARKAEAELVEKKLRLLEMENTEPGPITVPVSSTLPVVGLQKGMAPFDERKDDLHAYLLRFERVARSQQWPETHWAASLSMCLTGEALAVYSRMAPADCSDYEKVKAVLLKRFRLTAEGFRERFRSILPEDGESGTEFVTRLSSYFDRWVESSQVKDKDFAALRELIIREQFLLDCSASVALFLKEKKLKTVQDLSEAADDFMEAHGLRNLGHKHGKDGPVPPKPQNAVKGAGKTNESEQEKSGQERPKDRVGQSQICFLCGKLGHVANQCRSAWYTRRDITRCNHCGRMGHQSENCRNKPTETNQKGNKAQSACFVAANPEELNKNIENGYVELKSGEKVPVVNALLANKVKNLCPDLPVVEGRIDGRKVSVLRDTGSNTTVIRKSLVHEAQLTGRVGLVYLVDGSMRRLPEAIVSIKSPYFTGNVTAKVMEAPLYDVILGNNPGVRAVEDPDEDWEHEEDGPQNPALTDKSELGAEEESHGRDEKEGSTNDKHASCNDEGIENDIVAAVTRSQSRAAGNPVPKLRVPLIEGGPPDVATLARAQKEDPTIHSCFQKIGQSQQCHSTDRTFEYVEYGGILYRRYHGDEGSPVQQLVVPKQYRTTVMQLAHEGLMAGHLGIKKTIERTLTDFFWPGLQADVQRFVRSCDSCQKTTPKGRIARAPLQSMPTIDTPFQRVAIDIIGPISPPSRSGNRYILTLVDFATRYPDAIALKSVETERVAEALVDMFSRVGIPREILSDRGSNFTSGLMKEISRLLSIKQMHTTPYHPMANGLVERFNGTLKSMLRRMCEERPVDWDRYLPALLFAYREVPQESLGFSPFEMIFGRHVRGPLTVLKELWTKTNLPEETKTTYEYVVDLRNRLERTCNLAHEALEKSGARYRRYYNAKARGRKIVPGDRVLVLLPTDDNKLLMHWKGPFTVTGKRGAVDLEVDIGNVRKLFHMNMLKKYEHRDHPSRTVPKTDSESTLMTPQDGELPTSNVCAASCEEEVHEDELPVIRMTPSEDVSHVRVSSDIAAGKRRELDQLLNWYQFVFSDAPGRTDMIECHLQLTTDRPINVKQYPLPYALRATVDEEVQYMLQMGIIEPSGSAYNSPVVVVKKPDQTNRLCIDFRQLNKALVSTAEPIPNADEIFAGLANKRFFSKFDLSKGYWQVPLDDESKGKTAFSTPTGHYQFRYMPFGIKNAPAIFTQLMRRVLGGIRDVVHYYDDVLVASETWEEHLESLRIVLQRLARAGLTARPTKCEIGFNKVSFLGYEITEGTKIPLVKTLEKVQNTARPTTKRQIRSFLGLSGYYREFIPNYAAIAKPLTDATKKGAPNKITWTEDLARAFQGLKKALSSHPVLRLPDITRPFTLRTDASDTSLGAILLQEHDGVLHPVSFASRKLSAAETAYATVEKEGLALVWGITKFKPYLLGVPFTVQTDHRPLQYLNSTKHSNQRLLRWSLMLQEYDFTVQYIRGSDNVGADYLSRI